MQTLLNYGFEQIEWQITLLCFLLAFMLSSIIAIVYERTFQGLSYSRGLVQSMILGSLVSCLLMIAIGDNIARGIGIVGSLAIIRFRTNLRDPRDLIFLFASGYPLWILPNLLHGQSLYLPRQKNIHCPDNAIFL